MHTLHNIHNIHTLSILPKQQTINSIAQFSHHFNALDFDYTRLLIQIKQTAIDSNFMKNNDNSIWMHRCGSDFFANPKLFSHAPLTYLCVFLGELFNNCDVEEIQEKVPVSVMELALLRLNAFKRH